jgi:hypothetical protein
MPSPHRMLALHAFLATLTSLSPCAARPQDPPREPTAALGSTLFVATDDEVLTVASCADEDAGGCCSGKIAID